MANNSNAVLNIIFFQPNNTTKRSTGQLPQNFTLSGFEALFERLFPSPPYAKMKNYRILVNGVDLNVQDESEFNKNKHLIKNGSTLYPLQRCLGGSDVDMVTLRDIVRSELPSELNKIPKILNSCTIHGFEKAKFKLECFQCKNILNYAQFFKSPSFIQTLECLDQINTFQKCIDYQVCKCGSPMINETMYAQQQCLQCKRRFCFFCNSDWQEGQMKNEKYTCRKDCAYETLIDQPLVKLTYNLELEVPNKRVCPGCFRDGGYGNCCKYNQCHNCELWFCYMCLKPQAECSKTSSYSTKCTSELVKQTYEIFPRLIKP